MNEKYLNIEDSFMALTAPSLGKYGQSQGKLIFSFGDQIYILLFS